jgi:hypothetical protein
LPNESWGWKPKYFIHAQFQWFFFKMSLHTHPLFRKFRMMKCEVWEVSWRMFNSMSSLWRLRILQCRQRAPPEYCPTGRATCPRFLFGGHICF